MANKEKDNYPKGFPAQSQPEMEGKEHKMNPRPQYLAPWHKGSGLLEGQVALITGADSGIGRAVAVLFAREGANVAVNYLKSDDDANETKAMVEKEGRKCLLLRSDVSVRQNCFDMVEKCVKELGRLDVLVNNAAVQHVRKNIEEITEDQLTETFRTNIFSFFFMVQAALPHLRKNKGNIINTSSVTTFKGNQELLDYSSTKGAITAFTRSLSTNLAEEGIRVNAVAPGPIWTPFIPGSFDEKKVSEFGKQTPLGRAGQPEECAPAYVFLASRDASYITGQTIHPNGGYIVNS